MLISDMMQMANTRRGTILACGCCFIELCLYYLCFVYNCHFIPDTGICFCMLTFDVRMPCLGLWIGLCVQLSVWELRVLMEFMYNLVETVLGLSVYTSRDQWSVTKYYLKTTSIWRDCLFRLYQDRLYHQCQAAVSRDYLSQETICLKRLYVYQET